MTRDEIKNTPEIVDLILDGSVIADSKMKLHKRLEEICELAIKALEQEPCSDAISRQAAIVQLSHNKIGDDDRDVIIQRDIETIKALVPVTPQVDTARRIVGKSRGGMTLWYQCEICNEPIDERDTFCSGCGRRLVNG